MVSAKSEAICLRRVQNSRWKILMRLPALPAQAGQAGVFEKEN